jgi:cysteine desulfurase
MFDQIVYQAEISRFKGEKLLHYTVVNPETGVVWPLSLAVELKKQTGCAVIVDAAQWPGKVQAWKDLNPEIDAYVFSGHKFGALPGIGFSFVHRSFNWRPLFPGGGQQENLRGGTENVLGIYSLMLAFQELQERENFPRALQARNYLEEGLLQLLKGNGEIVAKDTERASQTISWIHHQKKADFLLAQFDQAGIAVSAGSACQSDLSRPNRVLSSMGYRDPYNRSMIRLSFEAHLSLESAKDYLQALAPVLQG